MGSKDEGSLPMPGMTEQTDARDSHDIAKSNVQAKFEVCCKDKANFQNELFVPPLLNSNIDL